MMIRHSTTHRRQCVTRTPAAFLAAYENSALNEVRDIALRGVLR